jgi:hypothetical protein
MYYSQEMKMGYEKDHQFSNGEPITPKPDGRSLSGESEFTG